MARVIDESSGELLFDDDDNSPPGDSGSDAHTGDGDPCARVWLRVEAEQRRAATIQGDLDNAEKSLRNERRMVARLKDELKETRNEVPEKAIVKMIFQHWVRVCRKHPRRTKLAEKRIKVVVARLRDGYEPDYIMQACDGAAVFAYTNPSTGVRYDDLELICRDEVHLERFHTLAEKNLKRSADDDLPDIGYDQG